MDTRQVEQWPQPWNNAANTKAKPLSLKRKHDDHEKLNIMNQTSPVRRRISRACDKCNQLRTKCDGNQPCRRCEESQYECRYARQHKKRGRAPKKEHSSEPTSTTQDSESPSYELQPRAATSVRPVLEDRQLSAQLFRYDHESIATPPIVPNAVLRSRHGFAQDYRSTVLSSSQRTFAELGNMPKDPSTGEGSNTCTFPNQSPTATSPSWTNNPSPQFEMRPPRQHQMV